ASQYDHTVDKYVRKNLNDRMYNLQNGQEVQREWYSSYLLYCYDLKSKDIDKIKCREEFGYFYEKELNLIDYIKKNKIRVMNSGIKIA
ncbi:MAG: hypothetical protein IJZ36_05030, partial [Bacilli bacterium]|nr:hypothetical protein [Bacilli bacterium]